MFAKLKVSPLYKFSINCLIKKKASTTNQIVGLLLTDGFCALFSLFQLSVFSTTGCFQVTKCQEWCWTNWVADVLGKPPSSDISQHKFLLSLNASESQKNVAHSEAYFVYLFSSVEEAMGMG